MSPPQLATSRGFARRLAGVWARLLLASLALALLCLAALLDLGSEPRRWLLAAGGCSAVAMALGQLPLLGRMLRPLGAYLDRRRNAEPSAEQRREAFAAALDLPRRAALLGAGSWLLPLAVLLPAMGLRFPAQWGLYESGVLALAAVIAAFLNGCCLLFRVKCITQSLRSALSNELPEPSERRVLIRPLGLRPKLLVCITGVALLPVVFAVVYAGANQQRSLEAFALGWQQRALEAVALRLPAEGLEAARRTVLAGGAALPASLRVELLESSELPEAAALGPEAGALLTAQLHQGLRRGSSAALDSAQLFSWLRLADGRVLVASTPRSDLRVEAWRPGKVFAGLLLASALAALGLAWLLSGDVSAAANTARAEVERMASGDLTRGRSCDSEDELGDLSRSVEALGGWLRTTIAGVFRAAERVEGTAGEVASVAEDVAAVTAEQVGGIQQAATSMEALNRQVRGIADSSQALNASVEESSSSILELGAAGEELRQTASVLANRVEEVSVSLEQMVNSVQQVSENTEGLSEASVETSASMEEMAVSMREVEQAAEETARLSREVVGSAEGGQRKVSQTIEGMDAIRDATETAERVIRTLGERASEIGAIVDVIDDVADETNLLALNAAIIAAQAGEHGRAFSVVADEIKDLADRVLVSTKEIGNLIRGVQEETTKAIGAIELGTASVASGVDLSAEAGVSLEDITRASRESGTRISAIVTAVREQVKAAAHVVNLMERVRGGVDEIRAAATEQNRGNAAVHQSSLAMREVTLQVRGTTEEQARGSGRLRDSIEEVRDAVGHINDALQEQSVACRSAVEVLEAVYHRTRSNEESASRLDHAMRSLLSQAANLRQAMQRFRI